MSLSSSVPTVSPPSSTSAPYPRLGLPFALRLPTLSTVSFLVGLFLGGSLGGRKAALQFRAENTHRAPTTTKGWYFYHKTKNYRVMYGGVLGGVRMGVGMAAWGAGFTIMEDAVDRLRGRVDAGNTVVAAMGLAGGFAGWHRLSYGLAVRTAKKGLLVGVAFGLAQDTLRMLKGQGGGVWEYVGIGRGRGLETGEVEEVA
ncbi:hypothetical protein BZA77DRAFT_297850 [Pyronema omphalodes]|nr:hypothetical protein BZA77DRAFT_297850 [Pyronema omphalodes]